MEETDLVPLREAARLTGKSQDTLKRWIKSGRLESQHRGNGANAPILVNRAEVMALVCMGASAPAHAGDILRSAPAMPQASTSATLVALRDHLADVKRERDDLRRELAEARTDMVQARERIAALERELNGGVRGLLTSARKRLGL